MLRVLPPTNQTCLVTNQVVSGCENLLQKVWLNLFMLHLPVLLQDSLNLGGKTHNIALQHGSQQCSKTTCTFFSFPFYCSLNKSKIKKWFLHLPSAVTENKIQLAATAGLEHSAFRFQIQGSISLLKFSHLVIHTYNFHHKRITSLQRKFSVLTGLAGEGNKPTPGQIELRLIQSLDDIRNPKITFKAHQVTNWNI